MTDFHAAPNSWSRKQLKWAVTFQRGHDLPDDAREEGSVPVYAGGGITGWHKESCASPPGIVTGRYGTIGEFHLVSTPYWPLNTALYSIDLYGNDPEYLRYLLDFLSPLFHVHAGKSAVPGVDRNDIHTIPVTLPCREQQQRIAVFLGGETRRIDGLLATKQRVLDLLSEKRKAIIATAVMRGLEPKVKLRDSCVPWLGEIPAHWELKRAKWMLTERDQRSVHGEEVLLSLRMDRGLVPHNDVSPKPTRPEELIGYKRVSPGELVVNRMRASMGLIAVSRQEGLVSPDYAVFRVGLGIDVSYYALLFRTDLMGAVFRSESTGMGTGSSGFLRLYSESFLSLWLPYPPPDEQRVIVKDIGREAAKIDSVRAATERTTMLLKERRAALIAAAVTGQLDVGTAA